MCVCVYLVLCRVLFVCLFVFVFLGASLNMWPMEVPRLGAELELQLPAYTTTTALPSQSHVFDLHHSSWQCQILNPWSKARDQIYLLMDTGQVSCH